MMILYGLDFWTTVSPLLTPRWQQGMASLKRLFKKSGALALITLYGFGPGFGLPEISPFVTKTEVQLKMAGLAYRKEKAMPPASPKGQLPYIVDDAESIANSTFIRAHIEGKYGFDFDAPLSLQARAQAWAFERMIEHHVYWALVGARWVDPENFAKGPAHFFDGAPEHMREKLREDAQFRVAENYLLSGLGRHAPDEDVDLAIRSLFALSVQLGDKPYLMGDTPCGTDATAFGALAGNPDAVLHLAIARAHRAVPKSHRLCRPDDAAILSGVCLDAAAAGRVNLRLARAGWPFNAASSASSSAIRASRAASAAATSAASNFCGMCCGQLVSQAEILNRMTCSGRAL